MKTFGAGVVLGLVALPVGVYIFVALGFPPVATSAPALPFERRIARLAKRARINKEMPKVSPVPADEANLMAGVGIYVQHCAMCHGLPGREPTAPAKGMFPQPPQLFKGKGVTNNAAGETYWKVANGIRLSGMPSFAATLSGTQLWQVTVLLVNANRLPASVRTALATMSSEQRQVDGTESPNR